MRTIDRGIDTDRPVDLARRVRVGEDLRVDQIPGAIPTEPAMTLPRRLPRPELSRQITPRGTRPIPPHNPLEHPTVLLKRPPALPRSDGHQRLNSSPSRIRESTSARHIPTLPQTTPGVMRHALGEDSPRGDKGGRCDQSTHGARTSARKKASTHFFPPEIRRTPCPNAMLVSASQ